MHDVRPEAPRSAHPLTLDAPLRAWIYLLIAIIAIAWAATSPVLEI